MTKTLASVAALLLSVSILLMGNGLQGTLLPVRASIEAFSTFDIGVLGSAYFFGFAGGCLRGPRLVRRAGHIRTFTAMVAIASAVVLAHHLILNPVVWWLLRATTGFCFAVLFMVIESWLNEKSTNENRGVVFSLYTMLNLTVVTLGQLVLILDQPTEFVLYAVASIMVSLAAVPVALTKAVAPAPIEAVKIRLGHLYALSPVGVAGCLALGMANGAFWALGPLFAQGAGMDLVGVAIFMSVAVIAGAIGQWPLGRLSDRIDRRIVIIAACGGAAVAGLSMFLFSHAWGGAIYVFGFAFGVFAFPLYALSVAHMNDFVGPRGHVEAASGLLLMFAFGAIVGPLVASAVVRTWGIDALFAYTACVHVAWAVFALYRMRRRARSPAEDHVAFEDSLRVAQTISTVDPLSRPTMTVNRSPRACHAAGSSALRRA